MCMDCFNKIPNKYEYPYSKQTFRYNYNGKKYRKYKQNKQNIINFKFHTANEKLETVYEYEYENENNFCIIS